MVRSPGGNHAQAVVLYAQPTGTSKIVLRMHPFFRVGRKWRATQPHFKIQIRRHWHLRFDLSAGVGGQTNFDCLDLSDAPVADEFAGGPEVRRGSLLAADLEYPAFGLNRVAHLA